MPLGWCGGISIVTQLMHRAAESVTPLYTEKVAQLKNIFQNVRELRYPP